MSEDPAHPGAQHPQPQRQELPPGGQLPEGEKPTRTQIDIEDQPCAAIGSRRISASAVHQNTDNWHVHIAIISGPPRPSGTSSLSRGSLSATGSLRRTGDSRTRPTRESHTREPSRGGGVAQSRAVGLPTSAQQGQSFLPALGSRGPARRCWRPATAGGRWLELHGGRGAPRPGDQAARRYSPGRIVAISASVSRRLWMLTVACPCRHSWMRSAPTSRLGRRQQSGPNAATPRRRGRTAETFNRTDAALATREAAMKAFANAMSPMNDSCEITIATGWRRSGRPIAWYSARQFSPYRRPEDPRSCQPQGTRGRGTARGSHPTPHPNLAGLLGSGGGERQRGRVARLARAPAAARAGRSRRRCSKPLTPVKRATSSTSTCVLRCDATDVDLSRRRWRVGTDEARQVRVNQVTAGAAFLALTLAVDRFGDRPLHVQGTEDFRRQVAQVAGISGWCSPLMRVWSGSAGRWWSHARTRLTGARKGIRGTLDIYNILAARTIADEGQGRPRARNTETPVGHSGSARRCRGVEQRGDAVCRVARTLSPGPWNPMVPSVCTVVVDHMDASAVGTEREGNIRVGGCGSQGCRQHRLGRRIGRHQQ